MPEKEERTYRGEGREDSGRETGTRLLDFLLPTVRCWEITNGEIGKRRGRSKGRGKREAREEGGEVRVGGFILVLELVSHHDKIQLVSSVLRCAHFV